jgi:hypothetical protein
MGLVFIESNWLGLSCSYWVYFGFSERDETKEVCEDVEVLYWLLNEWGVSWM